MQKLRGLALGAVVLGLVWSWASHSYAQCAGDAGNLVADCGFDGASAGAWTFGGTASVDSTNPESLPNDAILGTGTVSQSLTLSPGNTYTVSFALAADQTTIDNAGNYELQCLNPGAVCFDATVAVSFEGNDLDTIYADGSDLDGTYAGNFANSGTYASFSYSASPGSTPGTLLFTGTQDPGGTGLWYLDDVEVNCTSCSAAPVPEAPGWLVMAVGLIGLAAVRPIRRRTRAG